MSADIVDRKLAVAINMRLAVHRALDREDWPTVRETNRAADKAYLELSPSQASAYMQWIRTVVDVDSMIGLVTGGDA